MNAKQRDATERAYLALKVLEHLLRGAGLPLGVQAARDVMREMEAAFPRIETNAQRQVDNAR